jgi:hypothetical protein
MIDSCCNFMRLIICNLFLYCDVAIKKAVCIIFDAEARAQLPFLKKQIWLFEQFLILLVYLHQICSPFLISFFSFICSQMDLLIMIMFTRLHSKLNWSRPSPINPVRWLCQVVPSCIGGGFYGFTFPGKSSTTLELGYKFVDLLRMFKIFSMIKGFSWFRRAYASLSVSTVFALYVVPKISVFVSCFQKFCILFVTSKNIKINVAALSFSFSFDIYLYKQVVMELVALWCSA